MIKELKIVFFILVIIFFLIFTLRFYFSDENKKNTFRSINNINNKINAFSNKKFAEAEKICLEVLSKSDDADANHIIGCI